jgi:hypothetical protein
MTTAGFRFIPVDPHIVEPPVRFDQLDLSKPLPNGSVSGSLRITWTAETPVCIGDGGDPVRPIQIGGAYVLPGASLRGMVRAVAEIATFSHLGHINAARHYGVRTYDFDDMPPAPQRHRPQDLKAGWLKYGDGQWKLHRCPTIQVPRTNPRRGEPAHYGYDLGYWLVGFDEILSEIERRGAGAILRDQWREMTLAEKRHLLRETGLDRGLTGNRDAEGRRNGPLLDVGPYISDRPEGVRVASFDYWESFAQQAQQAMQRRVPGYLVCAGPTEVPKDDPKRAKMHEAIFLEPEPQGWTDLSPAFMNLFHTLHSNPGRTVREPAGNWRFWLAAMGWLGTRAGPHSNISFGDTDRRAEDPDPSGYDRYPGIPVFYHGDPAAVATDSGGPMATRPFFMGLTRVLRLPWPYSVGEVAHRLYNDHKDDEPRHYRVPRLGRPGGWDFARALFGEVDDAHMEANAARARAQVEGPARALAGRVSFGPAFAMGNPRPEPLRQGVFGTPRESFYPFYLARAANGSPSGTQRYDDPHAIPAGRKRYVVRRTPTPFPGGNANEQTLTRIEYLPAGTQFTGTVRFHNLDPVELGALLWALSFGDRSGNRYRHQIGRGKAQGYGVMRAGIAWRPQKVKIVNRDRIAPAGDPDQPETYLALFRDYMTAQLGCDFEATPQITALRCYADPAVGDRNPNQLITLPLEDHGDMTYPQLKRDFDKKGKNPGHPAGAKPVLAPLD